MPEVQDATRWVGSTVLFLLMAVVGLELTPADFRRVATAPRAVIGGTLAQVALLPLLTWAVIPSFGVPPVLGAGAFLVALAPCAGITTLLAALARANIALAVTLTALASVLCVITLPTVAALVLRLFLGESIAIEVPVAPLIGQLALSLLLPIGIGMGARSRWPELVAAHRVRIQRTVMIAIGALIALAIPFVDTSEMGEVSLTDIPHALSAGAVWALGAMGLGWLVGRGLALSADDRFTLLIAFTTRNVAIAAIVALSALDHLELALFSGVHWLTAYPLAAAAALARRWRRNLRIRPLVDEDVAATIALWHETRKDTYHFLATEAKLTPDDSARFFDRMIRPGADLWVAEERGQLLGYLARKGSYIDRLYVRPSAQRRGVGLALLEKARELSPNGLELHTHQENTKARRFYEKHGFRAVRFGVSPPPESAPDVEYHWRPE